MNLADIAQAEGDLEQAQRLLHQAVAAEPDRAYPYSFWGALQQQGQLAAAQAAYERALAIEADAVTHYRFGMLWLQQGQTSEARQQFMQAIARDPNEVKSLYQLALLALHSGEDTQAIYYLQRLTFLTPRNPEVFLLLGKLYMQRGQFARRSAVLVGSAAPPARPPGRAASAAAGVRGTATGTALSLMLPPHLLALAHEVIR